MTAPAPEDVHAAGVLARHLTGRLAAGIDPDHVGAALVALLRQHGWRPIPRPPQITGDARGDPPNTEFLAARQALDHKEP
ncbi:hypothetical protein AB0K34_05005 [Actinomadura sp. NPDC049382]|uniref:hypothetical protein n=1 Tax=Actinomadura sp. NPDC049382 TaxID=3158220 RepID=UPI00342C000E